MNKTVFKKADILIPHDIDMKKWSVVACDQYTSEPEYWNETEKIVGSAPSTMRITLPEIYLEHDDVSERIKNINDTMDRYFESGWLASHNDSLVYVERSLSDGSVRRGLIGAVDLEEYDYNKGSQTLIRATEGTVLERIPPRVKVRQNARLEVPHIMLLIDDEADSVIGPLSRHKSEFNKLYDFELMQGGGSIKGYDVPNEYADGIFCALDNLGDEAGFNKKYGVSGKGVLLFAVGDGNHSLATAKACYENIKNQNGTDSEEAKLSRFALVEVVNLHDESLKFEPIHRVVFDVDTDHMIKAIEKYYDISYDKCDCQSFEYMTSKGKKRIYVKNPSSNLAVGTLQNFLDAYIKEHGGKCDYVHGDDVVEKLSAESRNIGFLLPEMEKSELFLTVILDGALPRKTFSMGHACDKRFYLECRRIR